MPTERFTAVALPYSRAATSPFHVSVHISPRLEPDGPVGELGEFETFRAWTELLPHAEFQLLNQNGDFDAAPLLDDIDPAAWAAIFPPDTPVRGPSAPEWEARHWRTFRASEVHDTAKLLSLFSAATSPTTLPDAGFQGDLMSSIVNGALAALHIDRGRDWDESVVTRPLDERIHEPTSDVDRIPLDRLERNIADTRGFERMVLELHRARRFYERPESAVEFQARPTDGLIRPPLPPPEPDFHERVSLLGDQPGILRRLGLVIDFEVADLAALASSEWISVEAHARTDLRGMTARTACRVVGGAMATVGRTDEYLLGRLRLGDEQRYRIMDLDADGAALKTDRFLWSIPRLSKVGQSRAGANSAPPAQRTGGFTVARLNRGINTQELMANQAALGDDMLSGRDPLLNTEDVTQGLRIEVWDEQVAAWHSLHSRRVTADVVDHGPALVDVPEEGFAEGTTATETPGVDDSPVHVHEAVFSWGGWSLSVPRPGKRVRHEAGEEIVEETEVDPDPVTPVIVRSVVEPGTLPRLRYGRRYSFRAWGVDLAGNSRPHELGPPPPPPPALTARVAALTRSRPSPALSAGDGLEDALRAQSAATVVARRVLRVERPARPGLSRLDLGDARANEELVSRVINRRPKQRVGRATSSAPADRVALVDRAFESVVLDPDIALTAVGAELDPNVIASSIDDLADELDLAVDTVTALRPFLRWDPVQPPAVVARHTNSPGESLLHLVIRSGVVQDPDTLEITVVTPSDYAAAHPGSRYRATSERHLASPKTSQSEAEFHGMFDKAIGSQDPADHRLLMGTAVREAGTFFDIDVPTLADPNERDPQPGIALVTEPGVAPSTEKSLPLPVGEAPAPGQYVVHDVDQLRLPYLPDPVAAGISLVFPDAGPDRRIFFPFGTEGFTAPYGGRWPEHVPFRLVLETSPDLHGRVVSNRLEIGLPPGDIQRFRLSSSLDRADLGLFGFWQLLPPVLRDNPDVIEAAADGWLWILTPHDDVVLVHAVPRPLEAPRPTLLLPLRVKGSTQSGLLGAIDLHGPSTEQLVAEAKWTEYTDDPTLPVPDRQPLEGLGPTTKIRPNEDLAVLGGALDEDVLAEVDGFGPVWVHRAVHEWGDTKHRRVRYRFRASTRFREYFDPSTVQPVPLPDGAGFTDDGLSVVGPEVDVSIPSAARPAPPVVHSVIPLLRWDLGDEPEQPVAVRRNRRSGVRIYLERPWYSSGEDELLGVVLAPNGIAVGREDHVSQWGADPVWRSTEVRRGSLLLELENLMRLVRLDDRPGDAMPVVPPAMLPLPELKGSNVLVLGYRPQFNEERQLWYVDVAIDPDDKFWPFVRLSIVRYQPESLPGCHLSKTVKCDFVQLLPDRSLTVSRTDGRHVRVVLSGPIGTRDTPVDDFPPPGIAPHGAVRPNRIVVARLQRRDKELPTDLGWETVDTIEMIVRGTGTTAAEVAWVGELSSPRNIPLGKPGRSRNWRITVEEWEVLDGDRADLGERGPLIPQPRLIYADEAEL